MTVGLHPPGGRRATLETRRAMMRHRRKVVAVMTALTVLESMLVAAEPATAAVDSVKALDSAAMISNPRWFQDRFAEGFRLYILQSTSWGSCAAWPNAEPQLKMALDAGMKIAVYTRDPRCWAGGIGAAGPYVDQLQFFAVDVETDPGIPVTREMIDGVAAMGVRPVIYSGSGEWPAVMGASTAFAEVPLWDTNAAEVDPAGWAPNIDSPPAEPYGGWNTGGSPRVIIQQAFEVDLDGVRIDLNSVRADFLK